MSRARARVALLASAALAGCAAADALPPPSYPLSRTVEEPFRARVPPMRERTPWTPPALEEWSLANGVNVYFVPRAGAQVVSMAVVAYRAGFADSIAHSGYAGMLADMLVAGTRSHPGATHAAALRAIGAQVSSASYRYSTTLSLTVSREHRETALSLLSECVLEPELTEPEFARVLRSSVEQRRRSARSPDDLAWRSMGRMLFGPDNAYTGSSVHSVRAISERSRAELDRFYRERFVPSRVAVVVTGDASRAEVESMVTRTFGAWSAPAPPIAEHFVQRELPALPVPWRVIDNRGSSQAYIFVGFRMPGRVAPDYTAANAAHLVFSGTFGSRLNLAIRESLGLTYSTSSNIENCEDTAFATFQMDVDGARVREVLERIRLELRLLNERPVRAAELRAAQAAMRSRLYSYFETADSLRSLISGRPGRNPEPSWLTSFAQVEAITRESVFEATHRYFNERSMVVVVVGDRGQLAPQVLAASPHSALLESEEP